MFDILMVFLKKIEKVDFKKKNPEDDKKNAKFSSGQRVMSKWKATLAYEG